MFKSNILEYIWFELQIAYGQASIACEDTEDNIKQHLYQMNHVNDQYKQASKHVRLHAQAPKEKKTPKTKAGPKKGK